jgi:glycosyltransferase involved in cell wall biosynthesis
MATASFGADAGAVEPHHGRQEAASAGPFCLSVVIPVYNEKRWLAELLRRIQAVRIPKEIIIVDDGSTDGTREYLQSLRVENVRVVFQKENQGKGAALRVGFALATGTAVVVQDADLEYDPADYPRLLEPILDGRADVVYGSRYLGECRRVHFFRHTLANRILTVLSNFFTNLNLTDVHTCYKVFRIEVLRALNLQSNRFGFCPEVTAKLARRRPAYRIYEVPIRYTARSYEDGKKIRFKDAFDALYCTIRYSLLP